MSENLKTLFPIGEVYRIIKEFPMYQISNLGTVLNPKGESLTNTPSKSDGYVRHSLYKKTGGKPFNRLLHRLVAIAFVSAPTHLQDIERSKLEVNHLDKQRENCKMDNLEWCTRSENQLHKHRVEKIKPLSLEKEEQVLYFLKKKKYQNQIGQIALLLDVEYNQVYEVYRNLKFDEIIRKKLSNNK